MIDRRGPVPVARLARWRQEGAELSLEEDDGETGGPILFSTAGTVDLPGGRLVVCDLTSMVSLPRERDPGRTRAIEVPPGRYPVLAGACDTSEGMALVLVGVQLGAGPATRWERVGSYDHARVACACFLDEGRLATWVGHARHLEALHEHIDAASANAAHLWWHGATIDLDPAGNAVAVITSAEPDAVSVYAGRDAAGQLVAVVVDLHRSTVVEGEDA